MSPVSRRSLAVWRGALGFLHLLTKFLHQFRVGGFAEDLVELGKVLANPAMRERFQGLGAEMLDMSREAFAAFVKADFEKWRKIIAEAKITAE